MEDEQQSEAGRGSSSRLTFPVAAGGSPAGRRGRFRPCEAALQTVIQLAQAMLDSGDGAAPPPSLAQERLTRALRELPPETALKLRTLMIAGRDGRGLHTVRTNITLCDGDAAFEAAADDASESGPLLVEYLRRGHALARAMGLDLEQPLASWPSAEQDERKALG